MITKARGQFRRGTMNRTEEAYAQRLELLRRAGEIEWYRFEGIKLRLADNTFFTPDFFVMLPNGELEVHEVKGSLTYIQDDAMVKIKVSAELFPLRFFLIAPALKRDGGGWKIKEVGNGGKCSRA